MEFIRQNLTTINKNGLRRVWLIFLCHLREQRQITEFEFMDACMVGTEDEGCWYGRDNVELC